MKGLLFSIALLTASFAANAQSTEYRIDPLTDGSLYLVEIVTPAPDSTGKVGQPTEMPIKLKDMAALQTLIEGLNDMGAKVRKEAEIKAAVYESASVKIAALVAGKDEKPKLTTKPDKKGGKKN